MFPKLSHEYNPHLHVLAVSQLLHAIPESDPWKIPSRQMSLAEGEQEWHQASLNAAQSFIDFCDRATGYLDGMRKLAKVREGLIPASVPGIDDFHYAQAVLRLEDPKEVEATLKSTRLAFTSLTVGVVEGASQPTAKDISTARLVANRFLQAHGQSEEYFRTTY